MHSAEYYSNLQKVAEYQQKAKDEPVVEVRQALEAAAREYIRRAQKSEINA
jgi:hypothetical protein